MIEFNLPLNEDMRKKLQKKLNPIISLLSESLGIGKRGVFRVTSLEEGVVDPNMLVRVPRDLKSTGGLLLTVQTGIENKVVRGVYTGALPSSVAAIVKELNDKKWK